MPTRLPIRAVISRWTRLTRTASVVSTERVLASIALACALALLVGLADHGLRDNSTNSYGLLAQAFLTGRLDVDACPEGDCALFEGRTYIIFPPLPAAVALPFVAAFGPSFRYFGLLAAVFAAVAVLVWRHIFIELGIERRNRAWLLVAIAFASPLYFVTYSAGEVWPFAQVVGFLCLTLALWAAICRHSLLLATGLLGCAFLCRQLVIFWFPALVVLTVPWDAWQGRLGHTVWRITGAGAILACCVLVYWGYNWLRFGDALETGYRLIQNEGEYSFNYRIPEIGLFSGRYVLQNALYLFASGLHVHFGGRYLTEPQGLDPFGTSLLAASPWVLLAAYMRFDRLAAILLLVIGAIAGTTLFYHGNGYWQIHMQRFTLDWLPLLLVLMARPPISPVYAALPILVTWGIALNLVALVLQTRYGLYIPN